MCYQRPNHNSNTNNHGNEKPTHIPHSSFGHKWTEPYFDLQMPRNVTSLVGKSAYLGCRVRNLGNKTVAWIRHRDLHILTVGTYTYTTDQRFQTSFHRDIDEWTLQIKWAQKRDAGAYECQISTQPVRAFSVNLNIVDSIISDTDNLLQHYYSDDAFIIDSNRLLQRGEDEFAGLFPMRTIAVPTATILGGPDLYVDKGSTINLTCAIKFSPEPPTHIFWYHQDKVLSEDSERGGISFVASKEDSSKSILLIENADLPDSGKYSCYPSNTEIASIRVHVLNGERPEAMQTSGASRLKFIGYYPSLLKLTPTISVTTISTILTTIYSTTTLMHILMMAVLIKFYKKFLYHLDNWSIINTSTSSVTSITIPLSVKVTVTNFIDDKKNEKNIQDNNIISYPNCSDNFIITKPNELVYDTHSVNTINKSTIKLYNKFKECYRKVHHLDYNINHYQYQYQNKYKNNQYHCQYQEYDEQYNILMDIKKNQRISNEKIIHSCCSCFNFFNENIRNYNNCFNASNNNNNNNNKSNNNIKICCIVQHQPKNNSCHNKIDDFRKILTINFSQLRKNYLLKSSYSKLNMKNYHQNEINYHYECFCNCSCYCLNENNLFQYRQMQVSSRYLER